MFEKKNPRWMVALVALLAALLPILAVLQYDWIGAVSDSEQARMHRTLQAGVMRFVEDIDRPLEHTYDTFLLNNPPSSLDGLADVLTRRHRRWQATTVHPALLDAIYWVDFDAHHRPRLHRLDTTSVAFRPLAWPPHLAAWQAHFAQVGAASASKGTRLEPLPETPLPSDPPGLTIPLLPTLSHETDYALNPPRAGSYYVQPNYLFLLLDQPYITQTLFLTLANTYFLDDEALYDVVILHRDAPEQAVYRSDSTLSAADFAAPDASADLGLMSQVNVMAYVTNDGDGTTVTTRTHDSSSTHVDVDVQVTQAAQAIRYKAAETEGIRLTPPPVRAPGRLRDPRAMRLTETSGPAQPWRLLVRHKAGSIAAAVTHMRHRSLAVSFGILLVLGGATALLFVSARRARRLAEQQVAFVAGVTHELRTPLAVIRSAAENLADGVITEPVQARRYGALIHREGRRLSEIVEQTLALAGAQSNYPISDLRPIPVRPLLERALARCRPLLEERQIEVVLSGAEDLPPVRADAATLETALCNLLTNACKYGGEQGWIGLDAHCTPNGRAPELRIIVRDRGSGIPANELPHLFEPFYRGHAARYAQIRGNGLGLSLVQNTVRAHGGRVTVESKPGQGTAFTLHLPVALNA